MSRALLTLLIVAPLLQAQMPPTSARPNVVLIMTDDAGYGDFGVYGATDIRTPNIDRLAREGVKFTDFYSNGPTCTPTRAGLISGRYQQRAVLERPLGGVTTADSNLGLPATGRSLPQMLKNGGYATALIGKWHLGYRKEFSPNAHGFDYFLGLKSGYVDYYQHTDGAGKPDFFENETPITVSGYTTDLITERSVKFMAENKSRPFFIDVAYTAPHWPYQVPGAPSHARDNSRHLTPFDSTTSTRAEYAAMLERADYGVGRILRAIDSLGLRRNTIVIFTNDNGGEWLSRNAPFFHHKFTVWEGGIRVPAIIRWPARIAPGKVTSQVGLTMDLHASILAAAGIDASGSRLDGINLFPILEGRAPMVKRTVFWRVTGQRPQTAVRSGEWKLVTDGRALLFNLKTDPGERTNLIGRHSDIAKTLMSELTAWQRDVDAEAKANAPTSGSLSPISPKGGSTIPRR
jgi:arylsulfatase A-like enzyme